MPLSVCLQEIKSAGGQLAPALKDVLVTNIGVNSAANIIYKDEATGATLDRPRVIGSATEGALLIMIKSWGYDDREVKSSNYSKDTDKVRQAAHLQPPATQPHASSGPRRLSNVVLTICVWTWLSVWCCFSLSRSTPSTRARSAPRPSSLGRTAASASL